MNCEKLERFKKEIDLYSIIETNILQQPAQ